MAWKNAWDSVCHRRSSDSPISDSHCWYLENSRNFKIDKKKIQVYMHIHFSANTNLKGTPSIFQNYGIINKNKNKNKNNFILHRIKKKNTS